MILNPFKKKKEPVVPKKARKSSAKKNKSKPKKARVEETAGEEKKAEFSPEESTELGSQEDIENYYSGERARIEESAKSLEIKKAKAYVEVAKRDYAEMYLKKKKLQELHEDIRNHIQNLNTKAQELRKKKTRTKESLEKANRLSDAVETLEDEASQIRQTRKDLLSKEKKIVKQIKTTMADDDGDFAIIDQSDAVKLQELENSKEYALAEAMHLVSKEIRTATADQAILEKLTEKGKQNIIGLNRQIAELNRKKRELLEQQQLLELDEEKVQKELDEFKKKNEALEQKLSNFIHE